MGGSVGGFRPKNLPNSTFSEDLPADLKKKRIEQRQGASKPDETQQTENLQKGRNGAFFSEWVSFSSPDFIIHYTNISG